MDDKEQIQRRRAAAERIIRERHEALRREEKEKMKKSIEAHKEQVAKELRREQESLQRRMLQLDQDQLRKKELLNKTHAVTSRTSNLNGAAGTNSRGSPKKYAFGSSTPRELSYLDNPNIPKEFKNYDKKLLPVVGKEPPPAPTPDEIRRKSAPTDNKRLAPRPATGNAMSASMYVPSKTNANHRPSPPRPNTTLSSRTSPPSAMTQSVYLQTPKRPATTMTARREVAKTPTTRTPSSARSMSKDKELAPKPRSTANAVTAKKPPVPSLRNNGGANKDKDGKRIEKAPVAAIRKKSEEKNETKEKQKSLSPSPILHKEIPSEPLISFDVSQPTEGHEEKKEELMREHGIVEEKESEPVREYVIEEINDEKEIHEDMHNEEDEQQIEKVSTFSDNVAQETVVEAIKTTVQALSGENSSEEDFPPLRQRSEPREQQPPAELHANSDAFELNYSSAPVIPQPSAAIISDSYSMLSQENPLHADEAVFKHSMQHEIFSAEHEANEAQKREASVPLEEPFSEEKHQHADDAAQMHFPQKQDIQPEIIPQGMSLADELMGLSQEESEHSLDTARVNYEEQHSSNGAGEHRESSHEVQEQKQEEQGHEDEKPERIVEQPTSKPPTPPTSTVKIPSMEPEVRAKQEAENREFEERKARIAEILARSRATVQEVKSESNQRMPSRESTNGNGDGNLSKSNGHSSDEDFNGYGNLSESTTRRSSTQTSSSTTSGAQIPDVLKKLAAKHNMPSLNKIIQRHESDPKLNNNSGTPNGTASQVS